MADVREMYAQRIGAARMALSQGDRPAAADSFRSAVDVGRGDPGLQRELAPALVHLGKLDQELGRPDDAERDLNEALEIGERLYGAEDVSLAEVLNELSRLHIRQAQYARAEVVLERLLRITRAKGAEHPDVATALAGLAMVKRGLGDDAAAEQRYRDALRIRERVLAPNHMAIVITMEQLAETCAARGNLAEALALLQRALPTREAALGAEHATVRASRSRIASLTELRRLTVAAASAVTRSSPPLARVSGPVAARDVATLAPATPASAQPAATVAPVRSGPNDLVFLYEPEPAPRRVSQPRQRIATPPRATAVTPASPVSAPKASPIQMAPPAPRVHSAPTGPAASPIAALPIAVEPLAAELPAPAVQTDAPKRSSVPVPVADLRISAAQIAVDPSEWVPRRRTAHYLSAALAATIAIAALTSRSSGRAGRDDAARAAAEQRSATIATTEDGSTALGARSDSTGSLSITSQSLALLARAETRTSDSVARAAVPSAPVAPKRLARLTVPVFNTNVDSLVRASTKAGRESDQIGIVGGLRTSPIGDDASGTPPLLIGQAPLPYFPDALRSQRTEGEVVVRFRVDETGRVDVPSMKVLKSDHALFTLAVRNVLPRFRFDPARSPAPESKPRADWVDFRAEFTAKN